MAKNIQTINSHETMDFFMKSELYHGFEMPEYFKFAKVCSICVRQEMLHMGLHFGSCYFRRTIECKSRHIVQ